MATTSAQYTVTTSPVKIVPADISSEKVYIHCETAIAYLGGDNSVSSTTGYKLDVNDKVILDTHESELWIVSASSSSVSVLIITK
jgi:hypothetical protein